MLVIQARIYGIAKMKLEKKTLSVALRKLLIYEVYTFRTMEWHITQALDTLYKCCAHTRALSTLLFEALSLKNTVK